MHEFAHFIVSLITLGRPQSFNVLPSFGALFFSKCSDGLVLGAVSSMPLFRVSLVFSSLAPLAYWGVDGYLVYKLVILKEPVLEFYPTLGYEWVISVVLFVQLFWAGILSSADIKAVLTGLFSLSGTLIIFGGVLICKDYCF